MEDKTMDRPINSTFEHDGKKIMVALNDTDDLGYIFRSSVLVHCNYRCAFYSRGRCHGQLSVTGDCQPRYRNDHKKVFFLLCDA